MILGKVKRKNTLQWPESNLGPSRYEAGVFPIAPFRHGRCAVQTQTTAKESVTRKRRVQSSSSLDGGCMIFLCRTRLITIEALKELNGVLF